MRYFPYLSAYKKAVGNAGKYLKIRFSTEYFVYSSSRLLWKREKYKSTDNKNFTILSAYLYSSAAMENITEKINELKKLVSEFRKSVPELKATEVGIYRKEISGQLKVLESISSELREIQSDLNRVDSGKSEKSNSEKYVLAPDIEDPFQS